MTSEDEILSRLETLNAIGVALSSERDIGSLLERILEAARDFADADGGTLYRVKDDTLVFEVLRNDTLGYFMGGKHGEAIHFAPLPLYDADGSGNDSMVVAHAALSGLTINISDAYAAEGFDFSGTRAFDQKTGYRSQSFLTVPMKDHSGAVIGVLQLINAKDHDGKVCAFSHADQQLVESLASQAAIALNNRQLVEQLETLFESLISLVNTAIDEKSPYTGGHCERVPVLTSLLADAAARNSAGPLAGFSMTEADRYELKIAGLLHDCGKITTPVHVVDKATKLETLFDRIALIDTRFEVLLRDVEIARLKGEIDADEQAARVQHLLADRETVRSANTGGEFMDEGKLQAIARIGAHEWRPHGGETQAFLSANELENLSIRRGTLTAAEREIINHHIVMTIRMLEALPWPPHLTQVPEYAGGHHERMDGKGYPKGLTREQMSIPARVMGIADIFEALTARDRPYKPGKTLSESLRILGHMKLEGHVDPDLFDIFLRERVYLDYAKRFLEPAQIDVIDWTKMPGVDAGLAEHLLAADRNEGSH
ncbi:MAG TPA: HD domain-containing phosphohydrolase [Arenimonas sp.]|uniref:GAF and HD-GYP domain-containing protein n=1 Tax=Arenimonas sp. TaxID=1872635 RepID=UPI002B764BFD|nr:HD domain-containing phosphohydrolase [Arenimonas sp.]HMB55632.1 HD domain-containing phosphohydrolase [Arenimonas sp.]